MQHTLFTDALPTNLIALAGIAACVGIGVAQAGELKAVIFPMEAVELPATGQTQQRLERATDLLREQAKAKHLMVVDTAPQADALKRNLPLHECNGCDEDIAKALGADVEVTTAVRQASSAIYDLSGSVKDVRTGRVLRQGSVDVHGESPEEWAHAVKFLAKERLLEPPLPNDPKALAAEK